jgi:hypothetical protein
LHQYSVIFCHRIPTFLDLKKLPAAPHWYRPAIGLRITSGPVPHPAGNGGSGEPHALFFANFIPMPEILKVPEKKRS